MQRWQELRLGPAVVRLDFLLITIGVGLLLRPELGVALALAMGGHELGHALAAARFRGRFRWLLQVGGGSPYLLQLSRRAEAVVLLAGSLGSLGVAAVGYGLARRFGTAELGYFGADLAFCGLLWSGFQLLPFPPLDGGLLIRRALTERLKSATWAWRLGWFLGFAIVIGVVATNLSWLEPAIWLSAMTIALGRSEAGYVRHVDAYAAWSRGDHQDVLTRINRVPDWLPRSDRDRLYELGIASAIELSQGEVLESYAGKLLPQHPAAIRAAEWMLRNGRPYGARIAEHAYDALDAERVKAAELDRDRWADLMVHHAFYEAGEQREDSALGLLERAVLMGFDHVDRLEAEPRLAHLRQHPRYRALVEGLEHPTG